MPPITSVSQLGREVRKLVLSHKLGELKKPYQPEEVTPCRKDMPTSVTENQIPLVASNLTRVQMQTIGKVQEAVPRLRIVGPGGDLIGSGSACAINPSGLYLTAMHNAEANIVTSEFFNSFGDSFFGDLFALPDIRLFIDVPHIEDSSDSEHGIELETIPVTVLDYDPAIDVALLAVDKSKIKQDPRQFLSLETQMPQRSQTTYKIGHFDGREFNSLSAGKIVNPSMLSAPYPLITNNPSGRGDSGSITINDSGRVVGIPVFVSYSKLDNHKLKMDYVTPSTDLVEYALDLTSECFSGNASMYVTVLPYLEKALGKRDFNKLLDGEEVVITEKEIRQRKPKSVKTVIVLVDLGPPFDLDQLKKKT